MSEIILKQPVSMLNRNVKFDLKEFFIQASSTVAGTAIQVATANPIGALTSIVRGLSSTSKSISLEDVPVEQRAWLLVVTSLTHAIAKVLEDFNDLFDNNIEESQLNTVSEQLTNQVNEIEITLTNEFFNNPHQLSFLNDLSPLLNEWLQQLGLNDSQASSFIYQFKSQFPMSLHHEWGTNPAYYALIVEKLDTPFNTVNRLQRQASEYRYWLQQQVSERVFEEAFGLKQIYVPLRAYYIQTEEDSSDKTLNDDVIEAGSSNVFRSNRNENIVKTVCNLHEEINSWIDQNDTDDNLKVISGGPGSGKSSFAKILASELAEKSGMPVLFIPLHRFKISDYLPEAIKKFLDNHSILTRDNLLGESKLLLIFDGLDELSMQGSNSKEVANNFTEELKEVLREKRSLNWKAIVTGRELSIQQQKTKLKKQKTILHLLPYFINESDRDDFYDVNNLLLEDQRDEWWYKFGSLQGKSFNGLPQILATEHLEPITKEPLLNYLLSLSYLRQDITFTADTNLNQIYADLLDSVHERKYTDSRTHTGINNIEKETFIRILEEIALVVWHESGRTASIDKIMERCKEAGLGSYFEKFKGDAESGVVRLLMAFYFREFDGSQGNKSFEFTHKSFGEYLTARRIMLELEIMLEEVERGRKRPGSGWTLEDAFEKWIRLCGQQPIDGYLSNFLEGEMKVLAEREDGLLIIKRYQKLMIELIQMAVNGQSPVKKLNLATFSEDLIYIRNAETALLKIHSSCAKSTNEVIEKTKFENKEIFAKWLNLLDYRVMPKLNHLCFSNIEMSSIFIGGDFESSVFNNAILLFSDFFVANFKNASFERANLTEVKAESASFQNANLKNADLEAANFRGSNFIEANLKNANLNGTNFTNADLEGANLEGTNHEKAIFTGANLKGTILENLYPSKEEVKE
ncbi:pentapeptide repeat-containing protein [Psychrobacter sp. SCQQ22]|uniref:pentapeptide repeat-containing protein n=1 Tax=Psychrobacter sp. SCQQ22 TaxID=2792059 RepID=UPI0018CD6FED|nr:pentapeptide repeat-containing protein [Psychrobacter sp. SCQQ22]MBH0087007.1 pentapeptide repeat-containing protein [Psychrobacter sp. SCQQ22]